MSRVRGRWILRRWVELGDSVRCRHVSRHTWRRVGCWLRDVRRGASLPDGVAHARGVRGGQLLHRRRVVHWLPSRVVPECRQAVGVQGLRAGELLSCSVERAAELLSWHRCCFVGAERVRRLPCGGVSVRRRVECMRGVRPWRLVRHRLKRCDALRRGHVPRCCARRVAGQLRVVRGWPRVRQGFYGWQPVFSG